MKKYMEKLRTLDILSPSISLSVDGGDGVKTTFGAFMSFMWIAAVIVTATVMGMSYFRTDQPNVTKDVTSSEIYPKINCLDDGHLPVLFGSLDGLVSMTFEESLKYVTYVYQKTRWITRDEGLTYEAENINMPMIPCNQLSPEKRLKAGLVTAEDGLIGKLVEKFGVCVDYVEEETYVQGRAIDAVSDLLILSILPCSLDSGCVPESEARRFSIQMGIGSYNINLANYTDPASKAISADDYFYVNLAMGLTITRKLSTTQIKDQKNNFFSSQDIIRTEYSEVEREVSRIFARDPTQTSCTKAE